MKEKILNWRDKQLIRISDTCEAILKRRKNHRDERLRVKIKKDFAKFKTQMNILIDDHLLKDQTEDNFNSK